MNRRFGFGKYLGLWILAIAISYLDASATAYLRESLGIKAEGAFSLLPYVAETSEWYIAIETYRKVVLLFISIFCALQMSRIIDYRILAIVTIISAWLVCYYAWLYLLLGWPRSLLSYDVLYFFPAYWVAPIPAYLLLACSALVAAGALFYLTQSRIAPSPSPVHWALIAAGVITCLFAIMGESSYYSAGGSQPRFSWTAYWVGYLLAVVPVLQFIYGLARKQRARFR